MAAPPVGWPCTHHVQIRGGSEARRMPAASAFNSRSVTTEAASSVATPPEREGAPPRSFQAAVQGPPSWSKPGDVGQPGRSSAPRGITAGRAAAGLAERGPCGEGVGFLLLGVGRGPIDPLVSCPSVGFVVAICVRSFVRRAGSSACRRSEQGRQHGALDRGAISRRSGSASRHPRPGDGSCRHGRAVPRLRLVVFSLGDDVVQGEAVPFEHEVTLAQGAAAAVARSPLPSAARAPLRYPRTPESADASRYCHSTRRARGMVPT